MRKIEVNFWTRQGRVRRVGMITVQVGCFSTTHNDIWIGRKAMSRCRKIIENTVNDVRFSEIDDKDFLFLIAEKIFLVEECWEQAEDFVLRGEHKNSAPFRKIKKIRRINVNN
jgi:hypothetical protein